MARIPDGELWAAAQRSASGRCSTLVRERTVGAADAHRAPDPPRSTRQPRRSIRNALTIGFARRFATYKRATLLFRDQERLKRILNDPDRPVQIIFAGKAHPADEPGKAFIQADLSAQPTAGLRRTILFVEEYDANIGPLSWSSGVDVWLNNPRRPLEASGTSGQKAGLNGIPNFSVLDGWWRRGLRRDERLDHRRRSGSIRTRPLRTRPMRCRCTTRWRT